MAGCSPPSRVEARAAHELRVCQLAKIDFDGSGRSLLLAAAASLVSLAITVQFDDAAWWPANPLVHPAIATVLSSTVFWIMWPRRSSLALVVFSVMAFCVTTLVLMMA